MAYLLMVCLLRALASLPYTPLMRGFRKLQLVSAAFMAYAHGSNDAQKTMGIVTLALISAGYLHCRRPDPYLGDMHLGGGDGIRDSRRWGGGLSKRWAAS